jgi:mRNA-degrading endonuclease toxin of MazEF toxin-antitoxin module
VSTSPSQGDVYHVPKCPGLHGHAAKKRYVVVIHPNEMPKDKGVLIIPLSSSTLSDFLVPIPTKEDHPGCRTGLPRRCDAVCDQPKVIPLADLQERIGDVSPAILNRILQAHEQAQKPRIAKHKKTPKW